MINLFLLIGVQVFLLVGLFGLVVPIFPGTIVMWLAILVYALVDGWSGLGIFLFVVITLLMAASTIVDDVLIGGGARRAGAPWTTVLLALLAGIGGTIVFPPIGGVLAAPGVMLLMEYRRTRNWPQAWGTLKGMLTGWGLAFLARFGLGMLIMLLWWLWVWKG